MWSIRCNPKAFLALIFCKRSQTVLHKNVSHPIEKVRNFSINWKLLVHMVSCPSSPSSSYTLPQALLFPLPLSLPLSIPLLPHNTHILRGELHAVGIVLSQLSIGEGTGRRLSSNRPKKHSNITTEIGKIEGGWGIDIKIEINFDNLWFLYSGEKTVILPSPTTHTMRSLVAPSRHCRALRGVAPGAHDGKSVLLKSEPLLLLIIIVHIDHTVQEDARGLGGGAVGEMDVCQAPRHGAGQWHRPGSWGHG